MKVLECKKNLRELKPTEFADLIAMNALYRPGPMAYIPNYIKRKHGQEDVTYDLEAMREILEETYGITVYQEQVMLLSQKLAGFTKGQADTLRKAMGKKNRDLLAKLYTKFLDGGKALGHDEKKSLKRFGKTGMHLQIMPLISRIQHVMPLSHFKQRI